MSASSAESPASLLKTLAAGVPAVLHAQISQQGEFASFEGHWLPRSLLADIHVGHLNIIEAVIEGRAAPLDTPSLLADLDLPAEVRPEVLAFSLHSALAADGRFDQVGPDGKRAWFLRRLEPAEALQTPPALRCEPVEYERDDLPNDLRMAELELDDEWSDAATADPTPARASLPATSMLLTYPHVISGTLPLNRHARPFFKQGHGARTAVTLIDGRWGQRFTGWIVAEGRYIAGLRGWFEQHKLPAGAYITLERRDDSGEIVVDFGPAYAARVDAQGPGRRRQAGYPVAQRRSFVRIRRSHYPG